MSSRVRTMRFCWRCWPTCQSDTWRKVGFGELINCYSTGHRFFLEQQLPVQLENVLQVAAEYAPPTGYMAYQARPISQITHGRLRAIQPKILVQ